MTLWVVRAGKQGEREAIAIENNCVLAGWVEFSKDLSSLGDLQALRNALSETYAGEIKSNVISNWAGQLDAFRSAMKIGDIVVMPRKGQPFLSIGEIAGNYEFDLSAPPGAMHRRKVRWLDLSFPRNSLDQDILYSFGSLLTVFRPRAPQVEDRVRGALKGKTAQVGPESQAEDPSIVDLESLGRDQIVEVISRRYMGHGLAVLVDEILIADGFSTRRSPPGADGGVDILAGKGALGLEAPTIAVQVKSGSRPTDAATVRELQGVISRFGADYGLFVSWAGYTPAAEREAVRDFYKVRLWSGKELIDALLDRYDRLSPAFRAELPLKQVWAVVSDQQEE
ncbi:MAG: restriction endonuclease [Hyphomonadaceae bacterium]|nr:MAG: restriction endonuclease [Caulobacteraceae bacterium]MBT9445934.1 restriction endonuclease [Hyphomonadaceae bacterium]TPW04766.1 MAG: restriction endonuclease [Alphaproteobacteria bacterium]